MADYYNEKLQAKDARQLNQYRLSWVAYIQPAVVFFCLSALAVALVALSRYLDAVPGLVGVVVGVVASALFVYQALYLRSMILFTDEDGVWLFRGVLPWNKGIIGVKWRDIEDAVFFTGFVSWACNSYSIRVGHRFTKTSELVIAHVKDGHNAVEHINEIHQTKLGDSYR